MPSGSTTTSSTAASSRSATMRRALARTSPPARTTAAPPICNDREAPVPHPRDDEVGVGLPDTDPVHGDAGQPRGQLGVGGLVPLAVTGRAHWDRGGSVVVDDEPGPLLLIVAGGDLDVRGDTDAEPYRVTGVAPLPLFGTQVVVAGQLESGVERQLVVTRVVVGAGRGGQWEGRRVEEVAPAQLYRVDPLLGGEHVHRPFDGMRGFGAPGAAVGVGRGGVGDHALP